MSEEKQQRGRRTIVKEIEVAAPLEVVWKALTDGTELWRGGFLWKRRWNRVWAEKCGFRGGRRLKRRRRNSTRNYLSGRSPRLGRPR
jgi:hypothetical protein